MAALLQRTACEEPANERMQLAERLETAQTAALRSEYARAIGQIDRRVESIERLRERLEIADLKIRTAIGSLEQLDADLLRMRSLSDLEGGAAVRILERAVGELSQHLEDLASASRELESLG